MPYEIKLANRIREYLSLFPNMKIEEKKMFGGLAFMVNGKMCVNASGQNLVCRFDPARTEPFAEIFLPMGMNINFRIKKWQAFAWRGNAV